VESRSESANQSRSDSAPPSNISSARSEIVDATSGVTRRADAEGDEASGSGGLDQPRAGSLNEGKEDVSPLEAAGDRPPRGGGVLQSDAELGLFTPDSNPETTGGVDDNVRQNAPSAHTLSDLTPERWPALFERLRFSGILHNIALNLELNGCTRGHFNFTISQSDAALLNERHAAQLTQALQQQVDESIVATITIGDHRGQTPASRRAAVAAARLADAEQAIASDDALHRLMRTFDGEIIPGSIRPTAVDVEHQVMSADVERASEG
jgi:hypothetical protein